jgi:uncharacterized membrane protein
MIKDKLLNVCLILTSFIGYLEWGGNNSMFLLQGEIEIFSKFVKDPNSIVHPFILLPLIGQLLLLYTLFQKRTNKIITYIGIGGIGILLLFMFLIGLISLNYKILISTIPFLITAVLTVRNYHNRNLSNEL